MRLDELPRSDNVEDRRSQDRSFRIRAGRGGLGIGTIIVLALVARFNQFERI
jgi:predicted metalloprotease